MAVGSVQIVAEQTFRVQLGIYMKRKALLLVLLSSASGAFANPINEQIKALPEDRRQGIFARQLQREGESCPTVSRTFFQGSSGDGAAFWSVSCSGGKDWQFMVGTDPKGNIKFVDCRKVAALAGPKCFTKFK